MPSCPYCSKDCKARGLKNHVRLAGDEHGPKGELPDDFDDAIDEQEHMTDPTDGDDDDEPPAPGTAESEPESDATLVSPDEMLGDVDTSGPEENDDDGPYTYHFGTLTIRNVSPDDPNVEVCDGGESAVVGKADGGEPQKATANEGDLFVKTNDGNFLCEPRDDGEIYMVLSQ